MPDREAWVRALKLKPLPIQEQEHAYLNCGGRGGAQRRRSVYRDVVPKILNILSEYFRSRKFVFSEEFQDQKLPKILRLSKEVSKMFELIFRCVRDIFGTKTGGGGGGGGADPPNFCFGRLQPPSPVAPAPPPMVHECHSLPRRTSNSPTRFMTQNRRYERALINCLALSILTVLLKMY